MGFPCHPCSCGGGRGFPTLPSPLVVLLLFGWPFGVVGRSSRFHSHRGYLFDGVGRLGSQILIFGRRLPYFEGFFSFLGKVPSSSLRRAGPVFTGFCVPVCGLFVGARRGRLSYGSLRLDDGGLKNCTLSLDCFSAWLSGPRASIATLVLTWLILPVVICLSQRLSHACLSISFYTAKLRMAH